MPFKFNPVDFCFIMGKDAFIDIADGAIILEDDLTEVLMGKARGIIRIGKYLVLSYDLKPEMP